MATPQQLFDEYIQLRRKGLDAPTVLQQLRGRIELLPANERASIVKQVKVWESHQTDSVAPTPIKPISATGKTDSLQARQVTQQETNPAPVPAFVLPQNLETKPVPSPTPAKQVTPPIVCPNCGKMNDAKEVMCYSCGFVLQLQNSAFATVPLTGSDNPARDESYFGPDATLVMSVRGTNKVYRVQPQKQDHEIIVGRSDGSAMQPDIDLVDLGAGQLGVSRLHAAIQYNGKHHTISLSDMNSANGTFVNGQKLHPQEVRVLRHSDELRLGRMVFQVLFQQN